MHINIDDKSFHMKIGWKFFVEEFVNPFRDLFPFVFIVFDQISLYDALQMNSAKIYGCCFKAESDENY